MGAAYHAAFPRTVRSDRIAHWTKPMTLTVALRVRHDPPHAKKSIQEINPIAVRLRAKHAQRYGG